MTRSHSMILMGERCAEERHDSVAHDPVYGTFVIVHCLDHAFEYGVDKLLCVLRIAVGNQLRRTLDIGE